MERSRSFHPTADMSQHVCCRVWLHATHPVQHAAGPGSVQRPGLQLAQEVPQDRTRWQLVLGCACTHVLNTSHHSIRSLNLSFIALSFYL